MIPLFKTHFSIGGRSILTEKDIFRLHSESGLENLVVVEDSFSGFRKINRLAEEKGVKLVFGIRFSTVQSSIEEEPSKLVLLAKNSGGLILLRRIYSKAFTENNGVLILDTLDEEGLSDIQVAVPFYDSFLYQNLVNFGVSSLSFKKIRPWFFEEDNDHPFDHLLSARIKAFAGRGDLVVPAKSIFYENRSDFKAFQMFKAISNRSGGRTPTFDRPGIDGLCSAEFCFEAWKEKKSKNFYNGYKDK